MARPSGVNYPCYWMYPDNRSEWRWTYYAKNGEEIAVSSEGYTTKQNCRHSLDLIRASGTDAIYAPSEG
jgi:uncharacterized protein YegP (UPF0339 family)